MSQRRHRPVASGAPPSPKLPAPRKRFGQHFLKDTRVLDAIVKALGPLADRTVLEIGPGRGVLTDRLVERAARVVAVEVDRDLVAHLRSRYADHPHVEIIEADVLTVSLAALAGGPYVLAGNVPYYITTPIVFHALERPRPDVAVYLVQKEVADRLAAPPGDKIYGALSVNGSIAGGRGSLRCRRARSMAAAAPAASTTRPTRTGNMTRGYLSAIRRRGRCRRR